MCHLTEEQRYTIQVLREQNYSQKFISDQIGKNKSVICRELQRNSDQRNGCYKAELAIKKCAERHKLKKKKIHFTDEVKLYVESKLKEDLSPEQIAGIAKLESVCCVSHETIYQHIWHDKKQKGTLHTHLRNKGKKYRKRGVAKDKRGRIVGRIGIEERPKIVEEKNRFGDLEMDLVIGKDHKKAILTINDRATGMLKMDVIQNKEAENVVEKALELLNEWKPNLYTITSDNGKEFAKHTLIAEKLKISYFFANPYHSWERGANENLNGLIRQYFPKKYDFNLITKNDIKYVENKLNNRPRKRFGFLTPNQVYLQKLKNIGQVAFKT